MTDIKLPQVPNIDRWVPSSFGEFLGMRRRADGDYVAYEDHVEALHAYAREAVEADRAQRALDTDDGLTVAYLYGFEKGKDAALSAARAERLAEALKDLITWFPSAGTYRRLGFDPEAPMRAFEKARAALAQGQENKA